MSATKFRTKDGIYSDGDIISKGNVKLDDTQNSTIATNGKYLALDNSNNVIYLTTQNVIDDVVQGNFVTRQQALAFSLVF